MMKTDEEHAQAVRAAADQLATALSYAAFDGLVGQVRCRHIEGGAHITTVAIDVSMTRPLLEFPSE